MPAGDLIASLKESKILNGLSDKELQVVSTSGGAERCEPGRTLIQEGEIGKTLYIILKGTVEVFLPKQSDFADVQRATRVKLGRLSAGDCLGEYSVIDNNPASASVSTLEECILFKLSKNKFEELIARNDHFAKSVYLNMLKVLIKRSRKADKELDMVCFL